MSLHALQKLINILGLRYKMPCEFEIVRIPKLSKQKRRRRRRIKKLKSKHDKRRPLGRKLPNVTWKSTELIRQPTFRKKMKWVHISRLKVHAIAVSIVLSSVS
jgi:hypothetical protein